MHVGIASTRAPKVEGVKRAFKKLSARFSFNFFDITFEPLQIESGVSDTPLSIEELMRGARQRAESAYQKIISTVHEGERVLAVGVEGGLHVEREAVFLQSWACIFDGMQVSFGSSGSIEIPAALSQAVVRKGADLGKVIDVFAERHDVRSNEGTWGILTDDVITREDSFETAAVIALMPFFNKKIYDRSLSGT
jgi:inosine/xanthosine triphosphatase